MTPKRLLQFLFALLLLLPLGVEAAITLVGVAEGNSLSGGDITVTLPSMSQNDVAYVATGHAKILNDAGVSTAGYTELADFLNGVTYRFSVSRKVMGATPDTTVVCIGSGDVDYGNSCIAIVLRGVDTSTPEDATTTTAIGLAGAPNSPSITTVTANAWVVIFGGTDTTDSTITIPTGYSNRVDINANDVNDSTVGGATKEIASPGAEDPAAWTTWQVGNWAAVSVAVRPSTTVAVPLRLLMGVGQ